MKTRKCKVELSLFNRIDILNRNAIEVPAAKQVFRVVGVILARVRVSTVALWAYEALIAGLARTR